jgi:hypothetical protein
MSEESSESYKTTYETLKQIKKNLIELSTTDLSKIHIGHEWSWMPHVKDHIDFLIEQVGGLIEHLHDASPPVMSDEIKQRLIENSNSLDS